MESAAPQVPRPRFRRDSIVVLLLAAFAVSMVVYVQSQGQNPATSHVEAGRKYMRMNMGQAAEREWKAAARIDPESAEAWKLLAEHYLRSEDYEAALEPLRHLVRLKPDSPQVIDRLAACASRVGEPARILKEAESAMERDPKDIGAHVIAVKLLARSDDEQKRLTYLRRLVKLRPDDLDYLVLLARTLTNAHLYEEAAPLIERILSLDSSSVDGYGLRGRRRLDTGTSPQDLALAEADFRKALALNPHGAMIHLQLGKLYLRTSKPELSISHLETAARLLPDQPELYFHLAAAYTQANQQAKASLARKRFAQLRQESDLSSSLEKRCAANPDAFDLHLKAGLLALRRGDLDKADYFLNRAQALRQEDPQARNALQRLAQLTDEAQPAALDSRQ